MRCRSGSTQMSEGLRALVEQSTWQAQAMTRFLVERGLSLPFLEQPAQQASGATGCFHRRSS